MQAQEDGPHAPFPGWAEVDAMERRGTTWGVGSVALDWMVDEPGGRPVLGYLSVVVDEDAFVRAHAVTSGLPKPADLWGPLRRAIVDPMPPCQPERPSRLVMSHQDVAKKMRPVARKHGFAVEVVPDNPAAAVAREFRGATTRGAATQAWWSDIDADEISRTFRAISTFLEATPWRRVGSDEPCRVTIQGVGDFVVSVMGSGDDDLAGVLVFDRMEDFQALVELDGAAFDPSALPQASSVSWCVPPTSLHPADADRLARVMGVDVGEATYLMLPERVGGGRPVHSLEALRGVLVALARAFHARGHGSGQWLVEGRTVAVHALDDP